MKFGIDPSAPDITSVTPSNRKLRDFSGSATRDRAVEYGHGDGGDPTGKNKTRPALTREDVEANKQTYRDQIGAVLDVDKIERENGEWFLGQSFMDCVSLAIRYTVARMLERDDFTKRYKGGLPISVHEFLRCSGGLGRAGGHRDRRDRAAVQLARRARPAVAGRAGCAICMTVPLIEGLDGGQKMSKS